MIPQYNIDGLGAEYIYTQELEKKIAEFLRVKHCILVSSGTAALTLAYMAMWGREGEVEIPALTMIATANAAELTGLDVSFYDTYPRIEGLTTTPHVVHVSLNGRPTDLENIDYVTGGLFIEDACQSFGSVYNGKPLGTFGKIGCFSFSPQKILTSGAGGCVVTNDDNLADEIRRLKNFGRLGGGDVHDCMGYNFKFTDIQARILLEQMKDIETRVARKKYIYDRYARQLIQYMFPHEGTPWMVDMYTENRDGMADWLKENGIGTRKMYPIIPRQKPYLDKKNYPLSEKLSNQGLWLPSSLYITDDEIDFVCKTILSYVGR